MRSRVISVALESDHEAFAHRDDPIGRLADRIPCERRRGSTMLAKWGSRSVASARVPSDAESILPRRGMPPSIPLAASRRTVEGLRSFPRRRSVRDVPGLSGRISDQVTFQAVARHAWPSAEEASGRVQTPLSANDDYLFRPSSIRGCGRTRRLLRHQGVASSGQ